MSTLGHMTCVIMVTHYDYENLISSILTHYLIVCKLLIKLLMSLKPLNIYIFKKNNLHICPTPNSRETNNNDTPLAYDWYLVQTSRLSHRCQRHHPLSLKDT
ncbi:hypothetical protein CEXT_338451 [Caerostris extrusa]|uniref:Uncharacterized protein n=1 Tax=Caerostris extrusa TaxID=172846 RepID=A0AAV4VEE4_CAEEX|nr:hypothetical protein CEXT_338451 [Caerostris extrusa]